MKKFKAIFTTIVISFILSGCYLDDYRNIDKIHIDSIDPIFGFPLINSSVTIKDLLSAVDSTSFVEVRNDSVFLVFKQDMEFDLDLNAFKVPNKTFTGTIDLSPTGFAFEAYAQNYTTIESESEIRLVNLKSGTLTVEFLRDVLDENMEVTVIIKSLTTQANPDSLVFISNWASNSFTNAVSFDLAGATLKLEAKDEITGDPIYNTFTWAVSLKSDGQAAGQLTNNITISDVEFEKIIGLINHEVPIPTQTLDLGTFTSIVDGEINLSKPTIALKLGTSFGVPSTAEISNFTFKNSKNETFELQNEGAPSSNMLLLGEGNKNYLTYTTSVAPYVQQLFLLNSSNSNIENILPFLPVEALLNGKFVIGDYVGAVDDPHSFFVHDTSSFDMNLDIEVPLAGSIKNVKFQKDIENFSWPKIDSIPMLSDFDYKIEMLLKTTNQIPLTFGLQVVFMENGVAIDSLFNDVLVENIVQSPRVDNQGLPLAQTEKMSIVKMDREKYDKVSKASQMRLKLLLDTGTETQREVLFKASQKLDVQMAVRFQLILSPDI